MFTLSSSSEAFSHTYTHMPENCIHIFNPETDFALALGRKQYSPPKAIVEFRKSMALFPAMFARRGDAILLIDNHDEAELAKREGHDVALRKEVTILTPEMIPGHMALHPDVLVMPWGWNHSLLRMLSSYGIPRNLKKSESEIHVLRDLAHRRTTIPFNRFIADALPYLHPSIPSEFNDTDEAIDFLTANGKAYFKSPWSSSGRGVINSDGMTTDAIRRWIAGCIKRQGSVMAEIARNRTGDFASEWWCSNGHAEYIGLSLFDTSAEGRYLGNRILSQRELQKRIATLSPQWNDDVIESQRLAIDSLIAPHYNGPVGIDMFSTVEGDLNPCVEINLRLTMGLAALWKWNDKQIQI